ncbi:MAG: MerR family transcriptional regulator [Conexibacter sp.]|jgi:DNA-binding transcriptional MerR regulator|nr:MerR family transcriptional regulator [Conexibacter sp.]
MSSVPAPAGTPVGLRIGEVARLVGTTPRTIRYYEEIGLLPAGGDREAGRHRLYAPEDVERLREALRLKALLGVSLDELKGLLEAEEARGALRDEWHHGNPDAGRRREILDQMLGHVKDQLELLAGRRAEIARLERELRDKRARIEARIAEQP